MKKHILLLSLLMLHCARLPERPRHPPNTSAASSNLTCSAMGLVGTDTALSVSPITVLPLAQLTLKNVLIQSDSPFPGLPIRFLTLNADVNDSSGGYTRFDIQLLTKTGTVHTQKVPPGVPRWVPNLEAGTYRVSAVPCNSLGCREDLVQKLEYLQQVNDFSKFPDLYTSFQQCVSYIKQLQDSGELLVKQSKVLSTYFAKDKELKLSGNDSCKGPLADGEVAMNNIEKLGSPYVGEILSNPDAIATEYHQLELSSQNSTATGTDLKTSTEANANNTAKTVLLSLGIVGVAGGLMTFVASVAHAHGNGGWSSLLHTNAPTSPEGAVKETATVDVKESVSVDKTELARVKGLKISLGASIVGILATVAGAVAIGVSQSGVLGLAGTGTNTDIENARTPFDSTALFLTNVVLPLQRKLAQCSITLNEKIAASAPH